MAPGPARERLLARNVPVIAVSTALSLASMMLWMPVHSLILRDLGASDLIISAASAFWVSIAAVSQYWGGTLADRWGRKPMAAWPNMAYGLAVTLCSAMRSWQPYVLLYGLGQIGSGLGTPAYSAIPGESVPAERRGRAYGLVEGYISVGVVVGPLVGAWLMPHTGTRGLLFASGLLIIAANVLRLGFLTETRSSAHAGATFRFKSLFSPRLGRVLLALMAVNMLFATNMWGPFLSLHASDVMGLTRPAINTLTAAGFVVGALVSLLAGRATERWGPGRVLAPSLVGLAASTLVWAVQRSQASIYVTYALMAAAFQFCIVASDTYRIHALDEAARGRVLGAMGMVTSLATTPLAPLAGWLRGAVSPLAPFLLGLIPTALGLAALARRPRGLPAPRALDAAQ